MTDIELITEYRDIVIYISTLKRQLAWNQAHGLPVLNIPEQIQQLIRELIRFENLINTITDRRSRNIVRLRYVLGMSDMDTAEYIGISNVTANRICAAAIRSLA